MENIRKYDQELEKNRIIEKECLYFNYEYKGKNNKILLTIPKIFKKYEKNNDLYNRTMKKMNKYFYKLLVCKKVMDYNESLKLFSLIHWIYMSDYPIVKKVEDYKYNDKDFQRPYTLYLI